MENDKVADAEYCSSLAERFRREVAKRLVGQADVVDAVLTSFIAGGHVLLEGVPGLAKTLIAKTFADVSGLNFKRIQFTPDLLPADVTGTLIYDRVSGVFSAHKGPVFTNVLLADEINRAPSKVQSALLEAMAERHVTIGECTYSLPEPFFVLATQNPIEQDGTYNLPEAELDRFLLKITVPYPKEEEEKDVVKTAGRADSVPIDAVFYPHVILSIHDLLEEVVCDDKIIEYIVSIVRATRPQPQRNVPPSRKSAMHKALDDVKHLISFGASPRAGIALLRCAKASALLAGRTFVLPEDVQKNATAVLRHRLVLSYEAEASSVTADEIIARVISAVAVP